MADLVPYPPGENVTEKVHEAPGDKLDPQVFVSAKSVGLDPPKLTPLIFRITVPGFVSVMV